MEEKEIKLTLTLSKEEWAEVEEMAAQNASTSEEVLAEALEYAWPLLLAQRNIRRLKKKIKGLLEE